MDAKPAIKHLESGLDLTQHHGGLDENNLPQYNDENTAKVLRKIDWRLLPMLTLLYTLSYLDRGNIGNAKVAGMNEDLGLSSKQYNLILTVFLFLCAFLYSAI
ncbi:hypothetical protein NW767_013995 [Fusarium falciforme]|nr:hypothetical protein NW767_013995 [Fusarium falciforme]